MLWKCAKGHEWSTTLYRIKNMGRWCTQCAGNLPCGLSEAKEIAHSRGGMCLSTKYINLCVKSWYSYCINKHENLCREVITNILGPPSSIRRPDFLKYLNILEARTQHLLSTVWICYRGTRQTA